MKVLGIGDNVCDKYLETGTIYPGGNAMNFAVFSKELGIESAYLGTFGDDEVGRHIHDVVSDLGLDLSHARYAKGLNGMARAILIDGDRRFLPGIAGVAKTDAPVLTDLDMDYLKGFQLIHTSIYSFLEDELPKLKESGAFVSMDFSEDYTEEYLARCCPHVDCAILSCGKKSEEEIDRLIQKVESFGCTVVIATRGSRGALVSVEGRRYQQSPYLVKAVDTMGAGDAFLTCFLVHYVEARDEARDFPEGAEKGITTREDYMDALIRLSLCRAAVFAAAQCQRSGSFGHGKVIGLTEKDQEIMARAGLKD